MNYIFFLFDWVFFLHFEIKKDRRSSLDGITKSRKSKVDPSEANGSDQREEKVERVVIKS